MSNAEALAGFSEVEFYKLLDRGSSREDAAILAGLPLDFLSLWLENGAAGHEPYNAFLKNVRLCEARYKARLARAVQVNAEGNPAKGEKPNWSASAWLLERRFAPEFGRVDEEKVIHALDRRFAALETSLKSIVLRYVPEDFQEACADELEAAFQQGGE